MAWIESHQGLKNDPKLQRLRRHLHISRREAIGLVHLLWWYTLDHGGPEGDLSKIDPRDLAVELDWPEDDAARLWDALRSKGDAQPDAQSAQNDAQNGAQSRTSGIDTSGFIDPDGRVHEWRKYAGTLLRDRERKREKRKVNLQSELFPGSSPDSPGKSTYTQPNPTQPEPNQKNLPRVRNQEEVFELFWKCYPRRVDKGRARKTWLKLRADGVLLAKIMTAIDAQKKWSTWTKDGGKYIPYPSTWLNGERWNDEPPPDFNGRSGAARPRPGKYAGVGR